MTDTITPRLKLVDGQGDNCPLHMVEMVEGFKFAMMTYMERMRLLMPILSFRIILLRMIWDNMTL